MTQSHAMLAALGAYFFFVLSDTSIKFGQQVPVSPFYVMAIVGFVSATCIIAVSYFKQALPSLRPTRWPEQGGTAFCNVAQFLCLVVALKHLPLTHFYVFLFVSPLVVAVLSALLKHEVLTPIKIVCLVAGFCGTLLAIGVHGGSGDLIGYISVAVGTLFYSFRPLLVRRLEKTVKAESTVILCNLSVGTAGVLGLLLDPSAGTIGIRAVLIFISSGIVGVMGTVLYFRALQNTVSTNVAQLHYTQIIFAGVFGYMIWSEIPTWNLVVGSLIIIGSGMFLAAQTRKAQSAE